jgi:hypothetical protein
MPRTTTACIFTKSAAGTDDLSLQPHQQEIEGLFTAAIEIEKILRLNPCNIPINTSKVSDSTLP